MFAIAIALAVAAAAYAGYAAVTWWRYGRASGGEDEWLDEFLPDYEVVERHQVRVRAPAEVTYATACELDVEDVWVARWLMRMREWLLGSRVRRSDRPRGMKAGMQAIGWGVLREVTGRELVMGAVTKPWEAEVVFRAVEAEQFRGFGEEGFVKIAWTLRADAWGEWESRFRTETRVVACGAEARRRFRWYWAWLSPGIILIRWGMLGLVRREAERRWAEKVKWTGAGRAEEDILERQAREPAKNDADAR